MLIFKYNNEYIKNISYIYFIYIWTTLLYVSVQGKNYLRLHYNVYNIMFTYNEYQKNTCYLNISPPTELCDHSYVLLATNVKHILYHADM